MLGRRAMAVAIVSAFLVLLATALPAAAKPRKVTLELACAKRPGGALRYVRAADDCRSGERMVDFARDNPVYTCVRGRAAGIASIASQDRRGVIRRVSRDGGCGRDQELVLPGVGARSFCANARNGRLRYVRGGIPCHRSGELKAVLPRKSPADLRVSCVRKSNGLLRFAESSTRCR